MLRTDTAGSSAKAPVYRERLLRTLAVVGGASRRRRPVRLFGFGTKSVAVISLATLFPGRGRFQASSAQGTFEHFVLRLCATSLWESSRVALGANCRSPPVPFTLSDSDCNAVDNPRN
jgi:hypothetical protein